MNHPFIEGDKIYLRGLKREDLNGAMFQWTHDPRVTHYLFSGLRPNSAETMEEEYERLVRSDNDIVFAMMDKASEKHIGNAGLYVINWVSRSAEYRILIGETDFWNKGYGREAADLILEYGFEKLNLNRIWLGVNAENKGAVASYEKNGFQREGVLRQEIYRNGRYYDAIRMGLLKEEYHGKKA